METKGLPPVSPKERKENIIIAVVAILIALAMAIYSWFTLPDLVQTQPSFAYTGVPPFPKWAAVLFPFGLTTVLAISAINYRKQFAMCMLGYVLYIIFWLIN